MPFGTQVDALLDTLGSGTSEEVETALQSYSMRDIVGVLAQRLLDVEESGGGGGGSSTATSTVTTDGTFRASHVFDLGEGPHLVDVSLTLVSFALDGEPGGAGGIGVIDANAADGPGWETSRDGVAYLQATTSNASDDVDPSGMMVTPGENLAVMLTAVRYLRVSVGIQTTGDFTAYAGSNHPVASVRLDLVYI